MDSVSAVHVHTGSGLAGNANRGGRRQVTLLSAEAWYDAEQEIGLSLDPILRRSNLLVSGVDLEETRGKILAIGAVTILIHGETRPCNLMEAACPGLRDALTSHWRGGAYGEIVSEGEIRVGDPVEWTDAEDGS
jgi:MOSC domain-containing protein YiiM